MIRNLFSFIFIFLASAPAFCDSNDLRLHRPYFFLGLDAGYNRVNTDIGTEFDKNGFQIDGKVLASYYWENWVADAGFGWLYNRLSGSEFPVTDETITTRAVFAELGGRYQLSKNWQIGPLTRSVFGTDLEFGSQLNKTNFGFFAGLQGVYEIPISFLLLRLTAQFLTDLNIENRQVYLAEGGIQIGLPLMKTPKSYDETKPAVKITLEGGVFYFDFKSANLKSDAEAVVISMGKFLAEHLDLWEKLEIEGHTDERGSDAFNTELSKNRALAAQAALVQGGAPKSQMESAGFSFHRPKLSGHGEKIWRENRRVELKFFGVSDPKRLQDGLQKLKRH